MKTIFPNYDGTGRQPRAGQLTALDWVQEHLDSKILVMNLPVASGKSFLAKTIADRLSGHVITPSNILVDQYTSIYNWHNALKGKKHYVCHTGLSCQDWQDVCEQPACPDCPYTVAKERALKEPTFFNPMSLYYLTQHRLWTSPRTLIVDEAHSLISMLTMLASVKLPKSDYKYPYNATSEIVLAPYLTTLILKLREVAKMYADNLKQFRQVTDLIERLVLIQTGLHENPQNFAIYETRGRFRHKMDSFLHIVPLQPPRFLTKRLLSARRLILMSGTMFRPDINDLIGDQYYDYLELPSPIPADQRPVIYKPTSFKMNYETPAVDIARAIETVIDHNPGQNTIIHVSYSLSNKIKDHFRKPILYNTQENKDQILDIFKKKGGIFLAAGCAEGIDLPDDLCRLNIIPKLPFPDLKDPAVIKRKALADGQDWYNLSTFKTLIQQYGRSTRHEKDESRTYILDPNFARLYNRVKDKLPTYFKEAIRWGS